MEKLTKREKVMIGVSVVSVGVAGYFGFKYLKTNDIQAKNSLEKYQNELTTLLNQKDKFTAAQELYAIKNEE